MQSPRTPSTSHLFAVLLFSFCCYHLISANKQTSSSRSLNFELNPGCRNSTADCPRSTILHVQSTQPDNDTAFHYLWAFVWGYAPAIFTFETNSDAKLAIDWKRIIAGGGSKGGGKPIAGSIAFGANGTVANAFALELSQLYFVNFTNNATVLPISLPATEFKATQLSATDGEVSYQFETVDGPDYGSIEIVLNAHAAAGRSEEIPRLQFTESSLVLKITVRNFTLPETPEKKYIQSQLISNLTFAFESRESKDTLREDTSIDDEYTPGVFQRFIYEVLSKKATESSVENATAYAEYKPVAYIDDSKTIAKSIKVSTPETEKGLKLPTSGHSLLPAYFTSEDSQLTALRAFRFGNADDFSEYNFEKERYLQFSIAFGLNAVPGETLSLTLKVVIGVGLGLPMLLFIVSIIYTIVLKVRGRNAVGGGRGNGFATLTEEVPS